MIYHVSWWKFKGMMNGEIHSAIIKTSHSQVEITRNYSVFGHFSRSEDDRKFDSILVWFNEEVIEFYSHTFAMEQDIFISELKHFLLISLVQCHRCFSHFSTHFSDLVTFIRLSGKSLRVH